MEDLTARIIEALESIDCFTLSVSEDTYDLYKKCLENQGSLDDDQIELSRELYQKLFDFLERKAFYFVKIYISRSMDIIKTLHTNRRLSSTLKSLIDHFKILNPQADEMPANLSYIFGILSCYEDVYGETVGDKKTDIVDKNAVSKSKAPDIFHRTKPALK